MYVYVLYGVGDVSEGALQTPSIKKPKQEYNNSLKYLYQHWQTVLREHKANIINIDELSKIN